MAAKETSHAAAEETAPLSPLITVSAPRLPSLNDLYRSLALKEPPPPMKAKSSLGMIETPLVGFINHQHLKDIAQELGSIKLCWEDVPPIPFDEKIHHPWSYQNNTKKEKLLLWYSENFRRQFQYKFPSRRPLLLACENECGIQKMVCSTIRPTTIKYPDFQTWQGCAQFVADHLKYEVLKSPTVLPERVNSPDEVLNRQSGHTFEYSTLLASMLIGSSYDAYVVSGYATREICFNDNSRTECPYLQDMKEVVAIQEVEEEKKYGLRPPKDLRSQFLLEMEAREVQRQKDAIRAQELAELAAIKAFEKPPPDKLWSWRLHSWVLILPSKDIIQPVFIEPVSGVPKAIADPEYHGVESIWNHNNYWVLVQFSQKTKNCKDINFDLNNIECWEHMLIGEPITTRILPPEVADSEPEEVKRALIQAEKHLDLPASWVNRLELPHTVFEQRYPGARKIAHFRKCIGELYAPYVLEDGLLERVTRYSDYECEIPLDLREKYAHRTDNLYYIHKLMVEQWVHHRFHRGREDALKEHYFYMMETGIESRFTLEFYHEARLDGLSKLIMDPLFLTEHFEKRIDFLYYRHVDFKERDKPDSPLRLIRKITEKYHRNIEKRADLDVAMIEYFFPERKVYLKFHYEPEHVTATHREFLKPLPTEMGERLVFDPSLTSGYLTGPTVPSPKPLYLYQMEVKYFKEEELTVRKIRDREDELGLLLQLRAQEMATPHLEVSVFDEERNQAAKEGYKERERKIQEAKDRDLEMYCDFLAPYYAKLGYKPEAVLTLQVAQKMMEDCLLDWKNLLVARANDIQQQFEQTSQDIHDKNNWYDENSGSLTKEQEDEYYDFCKKNAFLLHILEIRLHRHRDLAPQRYLAMEAYLKNDPRMAVIFKPSRRHRPR